MPIRRVKQRCRPCTGTGLLGGQVDMAGGVLITTRQCPCCEGKGWYWTVEGDTAKELKDAK